MVALTNLLDAAWFSVLMPVWALDSGRGAAVLGLLFAVFSGSSALGAVCAAVWAARLPRYRIYLVAFLITGLPRFAVFAVETPLVALLLVFVASGFAAGFINPVLGAVTFERIPGPLIGRVTSMSTALRLVADAARRPARRPARRLLEPARRDARVRGGVPGGHHGPGVRPALEGDGRPHDAARGCGQLLNLSGVARAAQFRIPGRPGIPDPRPPDGIAGQGRSRRRRSLRGVTSTAKGTTMSGSFWDSFEKKQQQKIEKTGRRLSLPEGWSPIAESTAADKLYIILSGEVAVRRHGEQIATITAGDVMGEQGVLGHALRSASLVALTKLDLIHLTPDDVATLSADLPGFKDALDAAAAAHRS